MLLNTLFVAHCDNIELFWNFRHKINECHIWLYSYISCIISYARNVISREVALVYSWKPTLVLIDISPIVWISIYKLFPREELSIFLSAHDIVVDSTKTWIFIEIWILESPYPIFARNHHISADIIWLKNIWKCVFQIFCSYSRAYWKAFKLKYQVIHYVTIL